MKEQIKILFVSANAPSLFNRERIRPEEEYSNIRLMLEAAPLGYRFQLLQPLFATRIDNLQIELNKHRPHVVHFAGHASPLGIELEGEDGKVITVDTGALAHLFKAVNRPAFRSDGNRVKLLVLHACNTSGHAEMLTAVADFTIGTPVAVWDKDAINFAPAFYGSLASGQSINAALDSAFGITKMKNFPSEHAMKLFTQQGADPAVPFIDYVFRRPVIESRQPGGKPEKVWAPGKSGKRLKLYVEDEVRRQDDLERAIERQQKKKR